MTFDVSRRRFNDLARRAGDDDSLLAELLVAEHYGVAHDPAEWYDCQNKHTGAKFEVESTREVIDGRNPSKFVPTAGRFRLFEGQLRSLVAADARGTAWVVFVLFDEDRQPVDMRRMRPSTVLRLVNERGGWHESGHQKGKQHKVPIEAVL